MSGAIKCDRCGACYEYGGMTVGEEYDLCDGCVADFEAWMECQPVTGAPERVTNKGEMPHDTREKLEAELDSIISDALRNLRRTIYQCVEQRMDVLSFSDGEFIDFEHEEFVGEYVERAMKVLDRQAAITERECREYEDALREQHHKRIAELQREIATLKEHRAGNMERLHELTDECAELRKYRDEWKGLAEKYRADSIAAQEETERYRAKLGDVLDALHEAERAAR